jgi:hypothetical protein
LSFPRYYRFRDGIGSDGHGHSATMLGQYVGLQMETGRETHVVVVSTIVDSVENVLETYTVS